MDVVTLSWRGIDAHDSSGFNLAAVAAATHECVVHWARLDPGGRIGRHPTAGWQLLVVVDGEGRVSGGSGEAVTVRPGDAVLWEPDEMHETVTQDGLHALIVEASSISRWAW